VLKLLDTSIEAVNHLLYDDNPKPMMWGTVATISIGTLMGLGTGAVATIGIGLEVAGTVAQAFLNDEPPQQTDLSAPTAQEVAYNVSRALSQLDQDAWDKGDRDLEQAFRQLHATISDSRAKNVASNTSGPLNVARPALASASVAAILGGSFRPGH
jgi:hypothetical protein